MSDNPIFSRCSLGKHRWYWVVYRSWDTVFDGEQPEATGYAPTAQEAEQAAMTFAPNAEHYRAYMADHHHRDQCNKRRAAKPSSNGTKASAQEFLYTDWLSDFDNTWSSQRHLVVKKTRKLVFVERNSYNPDPWDRPTYALNRTKLEADGEVWCRPARDSFYTTPWEQRRQQWVSPDFAILGLKACASKDEVKAAYRRLARQHHPDCGGDPAKFKEVQQAYERAMAG